VEAIETACPFCGVALEATVAPKIPRARLGRAAVFAGAAAIGIATAACGGSSETDPDDGTGGDTAGTGGEEIEEDDAEESDHPTPMPYGAPPARDRLV
jgi:hypothetical protein